MNISVCEDTERTLVDVSRPAKVGTTVGISRHHSGTLVKMENSTNITPDDVIIVPSDVTIATPEVSLDSGDVTLTNAEVSLSSPPLVLAVSYIKVNFEFNYTKK